MFFHHDLRADHLPPRTLCLTYDDGPGETEPDAEGPGPHTTQLGRFLSDHGIPATFFVIGRHAEQFPDSLRLLKRWGHLIGNHTYTHPGLVSLAEQGGDVIAELARTDAIIDDLTTGPIRYFRPPYGNWRETVTPDSKDEHPTSTIAERLQRSGRFQSYVGPIHWDIVRADWGCWERGTPVEECAQGYLERIEELGRGIVLLHDSSENDEVRPRNQTMQMTRHMVPILLGQGYRFLRLDAIPQIHSAARVSQQWALRAESGKLVSLCEEQRNVLCASGESVGWPEMFGVIELGGNRIALRSWDGLFVGSSDARSGEVTALRTTIGEAETWQWESLGDHRLTLRTLAGHYLACERHAATSPRLITCSDRSEFERIDLFGGEAAYNEPEKRQALNKQG